MRSQLSCECVIVADYSLPVFTRTSGAPACSLAFSARVETGTPPIEQGKSITGEGYSEENAVFDLGA